MLIAAGSLLLYGCEGGLDSTSNSFRDAEASDRPAVANGTMHSDSPRQIRRNAGDDTLPVATMVDARPAALINGKQIQWGELRPMLNEAAGADVLEEVVVDLNLARQLEEAGVSISPDDVHRERELLIESLSPDRTVALRLLDELRTRRGLGEVRFNRLLERNARLRALVRSRVNVTEEQVRRLFEIRHGAKRQARLMVLPDLALAQQAIERVRSGRSFADVAVELSIDSSASRGGLLEPISRSDPTYPAALREEMWTLEAGEVSSPVLLDSQYAVIQLVRTIGADAVEYDSVRSDLQRAARLTQERLLMDELVQRMSKDATIVIFDESLRAAWKRSAGQR